MMIKRAAQLAAVLAMAATANVHAAVYSATETAEADAFIHGNSGTNNGSSTELQLKKDGGVSNARRAYFRIDASDLADISNATVTLRVLNSTLGNVSGSHDYTFDVYGLNPGFTPAGGELGESWDESTIVWSNAPANSGASPNVPDAGDTTFLGSFSPTVNNRGTTGDVISLTGSNGSALVNFIQDAAANGTDGKATFIVVRQTNQPNGSNTIVHKLASREYVPSGGSAGDWAPSVSVNETIAYEPFSYSPTPTELDARNGGTGFGGAWSTAGLTAATDVDTQSSPLYYNQGGVLAQGGPTALEIRTTNGAGTRALASTYSDDVYVSFLVRLDAGALNSNDFIAIGLAGNDTVAIGIKADEGTAGTTGNDFFVRTTNAASNTEYAGDIDGLGTFFIVGRLFKTGAVTNYDGFDLWVNPDFDDMGNPLVTASGTSAIASVNSLYLRAANIDAGDLVILDELRLGTTWRSVVPVPAPAALPTGLGLLGLIGLRRRPRRG